MLKGLEKLISDNKNLIYSITHYFENYPDKEDLFQIGVVGLIKAYQNYQEGLGTKFTTYAYPYILGEMKKYVREDRGIKVSRDITKLNLKIEKISILLSQKLMREPTNQEIADSLDIPLCLVEEAKGSINILQSMDDNFGDNDINLHEVIKDNNVTDIDTLITIRDALSKLSTEERDLIESRYLEDLTQSEVAKKLGMSQVQVSRYEAKVLTKMRNGLRI